MASPVDIYDFTEYNYKLQNRKVFMHMINILLDNMHSRYAYVLRSDKTFLTSILTA